MRSRAAKVTSTSVALLFLAMTLLNCSGAPPPDASGENEFVSRAATEQQGKVSVRVAVLTDDESRRYFGAEIADEGVQAVWLSVTNDGDVPLYYLQGTTDPQYFSAPEVARTVRRWWSAAANAATRDVLVRTAIRDTVPPHETVAGFVFTHREGGLKFIIATFIGGGERLDFRFVLPIAGMSYAIQRVDFSQLYPAGAIKPVDPAELRRQLEQLPCCTVDRDATRNGDPLNLVIVGDQGDAVFPFIERGWRLDEPLDLHSMVRTVRAFLFGTEYLTAPLSPLYVFGRTQDVALQKARDKISLRNHLRLWLAPFTVQGEPVWVGQISRDIGIKFSTQSWYLTTHRISPEVDQDRYYLLQDLILTGQVSQVAFVRGVGASTEAAPRTNLGGDPYVTDGLRVVIFLGSQRRPINEITFLDWEHPAF